MFFCAMTIPFSCPIFIVLTAFFLRSGEGSFLYILRLIYGSILIMIGAFLSQLKRYYLGGTFPLIQSKGTN